MWTPYRYKKSHSEEWQRESKLKNLLLLRSDHHRSEHRI
ncbi:hypothetical protein E9G94_RS10610 [Escherichia coli]